jgi:nucleoside-diphosphate-sugar epimerase
MNTNTNTEKLKSLGWFPRFSLEDGLKNTIDLEKKLKIE